jgi:hypothetical protein
MHSHHTHTTILCSKFDENVLGITAILVDTAIALGPALNANTHLLGLGGSIGHAILAKAHDVLKTVQGVGSVLHREREKEKQKRLA